MPREVRVDAHSNRRACLLALALLMLAAIGCDTVTLVGSGCKDGICPLAEGTDTCQVRTTDRQVSVSAPQADGRRFNGICWPNTLPRDEHGLATVRVRWILPAAARAPEGTPAHCADRPYLQPLKPEFEARFRRFSGREVCDLDQLPVLEPGQSPSGLGFFYDDFSERLRTGCPSSSPAVINMTNLPPPEGVLVDVVSDETLHVDGEPEQADDLICSGAGDSSLIGDRCMPSLEIFEQSQTVLETRSPACHGGPCLAYHLEGSTRDDCVPKEQATICDPETKQCEARVGCAGDDLERFVFCSCRCAAPDPKAELCRCGEDFACAPIIEAGDPALVGSYCVPKSIVTSL